MSEDRREIAELELVKGLVVVAEGAVVGELDH